MIRQPLSNGDVLQLNDRQYAIESVIGDGASCIVYSAYYLDGSGWKHRVKLKECYPYRSGALRSGQALVWQSEDEREQHLASFYTAYEKLMMWQNESFAVKVFDIFEANNTLYIVMTAESGKTFDRDDTGSLYEILSTVKLLTHFVGKYHANGYLHLDIKPGNFLVYPRPSEHIVLFDMDSVVAVDDIKSGRVKWVSYSDGWAAPEQKQGKISKLCPATDLYAIGAVLFEKVMGRPVSVEDTGLFVDWEFTGDLFEQVNPKVKRYLRDIFKKILCASVKRRYQTAGELEAIIDQALVAVSGVPYLQTESICSTIYFVGREQELAEVDRAFRGGKRMVFLHGFRGLGKSELARMYAQKFCNDYDVVQMVMYGSEFKSIREWLEWIPIENYDGVATEKVKKASGLLDDRTLIIVDNFNTRPGTDTGLNELLKKTRAKILVTTTADFSDIYQNIATHIEIGPLTSECLKELFEINSRHILSSAELPIFDALLTKIEFHTYFTELLAKQMEQSGADLIELYQEVCDGIAATSNPTCVMSVKDENPYEETVANIMRALFSIANLSDGQKQVLRNLCLLNFVKMTRKAYKEFTSAENFNDFNSLVQLGYIHENEGTFTVHSLLEELIKTDMSPNWDNCVGIYNYVLQVIDGFKTTTIYNSAVNAEALHYARFLSAFFIKCDLEKEEHLWLICRWFNLLAGSSLVMTRESWDKVDLDTLFDRCHKIALTKQGKVRAKILDALFGACFQAMNCGRDCSDERIMLGRTNYRRKLFFVLFNELWDIAQADKNYHTLDMLSEIMLPIINQETAEEALLRAIGFRNTKIRTTTLLTGSLFGAAQKIHSYNPKLFDLSADGTCTYYGRRWPDLEYREYVKAHNRQQPGNELQFDDMDPEYEEDDLAGAEDWYSIKEPLVQEYEQSADKSLWMQNLMISLNDTPSLIVEILETIANQFFDQFMGVTQLDVDHTAKYASISDYEWAQASELLRVAFDFIEKHPSIKVEIRDYYNYLIAYRLIYLAHMDDPEFFPVAMQMAYEGGERRDSYMKEHGTHLPDSLTDAMFACWNMGKAYYAVPILHGIALECSAKPLDQLQTQTYRGALYEVFEMLYRFTTKALEKEMVPENLVDKLQKIKLWCTKCKGVIARKMFEMKEEEC